MKKIPLVLLFLVCLLLSVGSFGLAGYIEFFGPPQPKMPQGEMSKTFSLVMLGFVLGFIATFFALVIGDMLESKPKPQKPKQQ